MSSLTKTLAELRRDYAQEELSEESINRDPIAQFEKWFAEALSAEIPEPNAMVLATADKGGHPSARTVLLKGIERGSFVFYTNYNSSKGKNISENPYVSACFLWLGLERQVIVKGKATKVPREESEAYFSIRPRGSQIGAWVSNQSSEITKEELIKKTTELEREYGNDKTIPCPDYWGGFSIEPESIEFWQGRPSRLHDRIVFTREGNTWHIARLSP